MFEKVLRFFVINSRLNYFLFILVFMMGIVLYIKTPKEIFPSFELDMISINGHYTGSSIDMLDKMAVKEIETGLKPKQSGPQVAVQINNYDKLMKDLME